VPRVSPLYSQVVFRSQASGAFCGIADMAEGLHSSCQDVVPFPSRMLPLPAFRRLSLSGASLGKTARVTRSVLVRSNNRLPLGNCDSRRAETTLALLYSTRSGFLSLLVAGSLISRCWRRANAFRGIREYCLVRREFRHRLRRDRANQPGPVFPRSPGIIEERL